MPGGRQLLSLEGHASRVNGVALSPDGSRLASRSADGTVRLWDLQNGQEVLTLKVDGVGKGGRLQPRRAVPRLLGRQV